MYFMLPEQSNTPLQISVYQLNVGLQEEITSCFFRIGRSHRLERFVERVTILYYLYPLL